MKNTRIAGKTVFDHSRKAAKQETKQKHKQNKIQT